MTIQLNTDLEAVSVDFDIEEQNVGQQVLAQVIIMSVIAQELARTADLAQFYAQNAISI